MQWPRWLWQPLFYPLAGGGGGNSLNPTVGYNYNPPPPSTTFEETITTASQVDSFRQPITESGTLTITTAGNGNPNIRVFDAAGNEIPGRQGSYIVTITKEVRDRGSYVTVEFYEGTVGESYTATTEFAYADAGQLLAEQAHLPVRHTAGIRHAREEGTNTSAELNFSMTRNKNGQYVVTLGDRTHTFTNEELTSWGGEHEGGDNADTDPNMAFSVHSEYMETLSANTSSGNHYLVIHSWRELQEVDGSNPRYRGFNIVGVPTRDFTQRAGTATFTGDARLRLYQADFEEDEDYDDIHEVWNSSDLTLTADFDNWMVSGQINDLAPENTDEDLGTYTLTMPATAFTSDGFSGNFDVTSTNNGDRLNVGFGGSFYGPNAQNVAGTMSAGGMLDDLEGGTVPVVGYGWFRTSNN